MTRIPGTSTPLPERATSRAPETAARHRRGRPLWTALLGFALGGFFDGILLHQILQWHHLLSLVPGMADLRLQVLWDGYFHALMYLLAAVALWGLWRAPVRDGTWAMLGLLACGFGAWHVVDAVLSHWLLGLHRIRLDTARPLAWDLGWMVGFGLLPMALGWWLWRRPQGGPPPSGPALAMLALAVLGTGAWAARPPPDQPFTTVVFAPGTDAEAALRAAGLGQVERVWSDPSGVAVLRLGDGDSAWRLYRHGAILVSGAGVPAGCLNWSRA